MTRAQHDPGQLVTARWRESFVIFWDDLPPRVTLPTGRSTLKGTLLASAQRLSSTARADGELAGRDDHYTERQLAAALAMSSSTAHGVLRWFEATGWLSRRRTPNRRDADERALVIPAGAVIAWPGWPLVVQPPSSTVETRNASVVDLRPNSTSETRSNPGPAAAQPTLSDSAFQSERSGVSIQATSCFDSDGLAFHRSNPNGEVLPGNPDVPVTRHVGGNLDIPPYNPPSSPTAAQPDASPSGQVLKLLVFGNERLERVQQLLVDVIRQANITPAAKARWIDHAAELSPQLARSNITDRSIKLRAKPFFQTRLWCNSGDAKQAAHFRAHMLRGVAQRQESQP